MIGLALGRVPAIEVAEDDSLPAQCVSVDGEIVALIDDEDAWDLGHESYAGGLRAWIEKVAPPLIFKLQYRRGGDYPPGTLSAGYPSPHPAFYALDSPADLSTRQRSIEVSARMRTGGYRFERDDLPWMLARRALVREAGRLRAHSFEVRTGRVPFDSYLRELFDSELGFNYRGFGALTFRIAEYLRAGVVMLTDPLGAEWPLREDVVLEDGIHCVFCDSPAEFRREALALLRDRRRIAAFRVRGLELWRDRLSLDAAGEWYWRQLAAFLPHRTVEGSA